MFNNAQTNRYTIVHIYESKFFSLTRLPLKIKNMKKLTVHLITFVLLVLLKIMCKFVVPLSKPLRRLLGEFVLDVLDMEMEGLNPHYVMPHRLYELYRNY